MAKKQNKLSHSHCNRCGHETKHHILFRKHIAGGEVVENYGPLNWSDDYELLECAGCETVSMRHSAWFEPSGDLTIRIYPPPAARHQPQWLRKLPLKMHLLMKQVYTALDANSRALALMGARAVVDLVLVEKIGDVGGFKDKLKAAEADGIIGSKNREVLDAALDAGNAATHRGHQATSDDVHAVMDIVENLLQAVYHLESLADRLKRATPPRVKAKP